MSQKKAKKGKKSQKAASNPMVHKKAKGHVHKAKAAKRPKRNPSIKGAGRTVRTAAKTPIHFLKLALIAIASFVLTRQAPQFLLKAKNAGWMGYAANGATAGGCYASASLMGKQEALAAGIGGAMYTVIRIITERLSPVGQMFQLSGLSGLGDPMAAGNLGAISPGYFPVPVVRDRATGKPMIPPLILQAMKDELNKAFAAQAQTARGLPSGSPAPLAGIRRGR